MDELVYQDEFIIKVHREELNCWDIQIKTGGPYQVMELLTVYKLPVYSDLINHPYALTRLCKEFELITWYSDSGVLVPEDYIGDGERIRIKDLRTLADLNFTIDSEGNYYIDSYFIDEHGEKIGTQTKLVPKKKETNEKSDPVNHPTHYTSGNIECIDAIRESMSLLEYHGYLKGNVMKYLWRYS